ncbi:hypothetical protein RugamoR57_34210 [Duganella caerulea]
MTADFVVYIDEAGDEGFKFLEGERGSSRWFVLSATVARKSNDLQMVKIAKDARTLLGKPEKFVFHFRELKHEQRIPWYGLSVECRSRPSTCSFINRQFQILKIFSKRRTSFTGTRLGCCWSE